MHHAPPQREEGFTRRLLQDAFDVDVVLAAVRLDRLTTTRVAERADVSVGTLYQYHPNEQTIGYCLARKRAGSSAGRSLPSVPPAALGGGHVDGGAETRT
jgi:hypothetical protein